MSERINYIRGLRRRANLTQGELAFLLGAKCESKISRYERQLREPNLYSALSYQVVFRTSVDRLFPDIYAKVESRVIERAHELMREIEAQHAPSGRSDFKQDFLRGVIATRPMEERSDLWENKKNRRFYLP